MRVADVSVLACWTWFLLCNAGTSAKQGTRTLAHHGVGLLTGAAWCFLGAFLIQRASGRILSKNDCGG
jgi:hypothetical protein